MPISPILPISGRNGFLSIGLEYTRLLAWSFSSIRTRSMYRTSNSLQKPVRRRGVFDTRVTVQGVDYIPTLFNFGENFTSVNFNIGWYDFFNYKRKFIPFYGMMTEFKVDFDYTAQADEGYVWTATFIGTMSPKILDENELENDLSDLDFQQALEGCFSSPCEQPILTSDNDLHEGNIYHVNKASIIIAHDRMLYRTSDSKGHYKEKFSVLDERVIMTVVGDFDYWVNQVNTNNKFNYRFYYRPDATTYWALNRMVVENASNFIVNVKTGELLSMDVNLATAILA